MLKDVDLWEGLEFSETQMLFFVVKKDLACFVPKTRLIDLGEKHLTYIVPKCVFIYAQSESYSISDPESSCVMSCRFISVVKVMAVGTEVSLTLAETRRLPRLSDLEKIAMIAATLRLPAHFQRSRNVTHVCASGTYKSERVWQAAKHGGLSFVDELLSTWPFQHSDSSQLFREM